MKTVQRIQMGEGTFSNQPLTHLSFLKCYRALSRKGRGRDNNRRKARIATTALRCIALLLATCFLATPAAADDFYQSKRITLVVGFNPGGGIDTAGRLIAKHLSRFIPGNPGITVQNMEGAGGVVAANFVNRAAPDGLTLGVPGRSWFIVGAVKNPAAKFDPATMTYVGSSGVMNSALWMRSDSGIASFAQLLTAKEKVVLGALNATSQDSMAPAMLAQNGVPVRVIRGYNSSAKVLLAIEQGEVPGIFHIVDGFAKRPDLIENKIVVPILQTQPMYPGLPLFRDVIRASDRPLANLVLAGEEFGVLLAGPPGIPAERIVILRQAFAAMAEDKEYQADLARMDVPRGTPLSGEAIAARMRSLVDTTTPAIAAAYERLKE
jgi:tripartite-type tricarboxylate transporter receptor subunit TctC